MKGLFIVIALAVAALSVPHSAHANQKDNIILDTECSDKGVCIETIEVRGAYKIPKRIFKVDRYGRRMKRGEKNLKQMVKESKFQRATK